MANTVNAAALMEKPLVTGLGGIARRVELVRGFDDFLAHAGHLRISLCVVDNWAIGVIRDDNARQREHSHRRDADSVDAGETEGLGREVGGQYCGDNAKMAGSMEMRP